MVSGQYFRAQLTDRSGLQIRPWEQPFKIVMRSLRSTMTIQDTVHMGLILTKDDRPRELFGYQAKANNGSIVSIQHRYTPKPGLRFRA
jgi:cystathionine beta-lyase/cystathionine gamma-synthase